MSVITLPQSVATRGAIKETAEARAFRETTPAQWFPYATAAPGKPETPKITLAVRNLRQQHTALSSKRS